MTELLTAAQMRAVEEDAIASGKVSGLELMERAGRGVVEAIIERRPDLATAPHRAVVLCGPGNNGGDGFVVARVLKERGWDVQVHLYGCEAKLPPDAAENARRWRKMGDILPMSQVRVLPGKEGHCAVVVDALFGTGLSRPLSDLCSLTQTMTVAFDKYRPKSEYPLIVAVDTPSGTCSDSGRILRDGALSCSCQRIPAHLTVTFHRPRVGHYLSGDAGSCGRLIVKDIGLRSRPDSDTVQLAGPPALQSKDPFRHKYSHGHALVLSGGPGRGGAARLAARGALRIGAGLVTVGCPPDALAENAARLDAVMLSALDGTDALLREITGRKVRAICIGPGFGAGDRLRQFASVVLGMGVTSRGKAASAEAEIPRVVLDADVLSEYADDPAELFAMLHDGCVLTPHQGEFGRLFPDLLEKLTAPTAKGPAFSKVDATREAAARAGCCVLFKGADTVIAAPDGRCVINSALYERAVPWLATAGSGDVLAGFIAGLLARGRAAFEAACAAAWLHVECARAFGPGLIAEDLPEMMPAVLRALEDG